ncbi:NAD(P)-dependent alcohol dehydrogenase [Synoicihabitans lomoniglobus]|uniref:NAD(P)-dependent alcohol dehydrogenase n=1 Tax=Synoicihabitans lomoniglobus TaxID=2909285 RepID=A0AAE9ZWK5_9BACT|nr:NAD(P)-dependent alcohol dehydrogenase [Opitutaceae bacterium LMO-M01]WED65596.1 NAD(P)-dependent alcohol dehydrogenase [Opitutaceae bacterium LMO-M01]
MKALVLERQDILSLRDFDIAETLGPDDVRIAIKTVGICGSDLHYYTHGRIGPFVVEAPMILGHEAAGVVAETGPNVTHLAVGDRVCMEPGIPNPLGRATQLGLYNLDPDVRFWATPPIHGVLRPSVVHPAQFTFKVPDAVSLGEAALVEPLAVGMHAATKARVKPGDVAVVLGAGTIGLVTALSALAAGCSRVFITDVAQPKLDLAATLGAITPVNIANESLPEIIAAATDGWGADLVFEASGNARAAASVFETLCPGGCVVYIGMPGGPIPYDVVAAQIKEARVEHVFRYAHVFPRCLALMGSGQLNVKPLITETYAFADSIAAFDYAKAPAPTSVKVQIEI